MTFVTLLVGFSVLLIAASMLGTWIPDLRRVRGATSARESRRQNDRLRDSDLFDRRQDRAREFRDRIRKERLKRESERPSRPLGSVPPPPDQARGKPASKDQVFREALELGPGPITPELLRRQYRQLMAAYHPDRVVGLGRKLRTLAEEESKTINQAHVYFKALLSHEKREKSSI